MARFVMSVFAMGLLVLAAGCAANAIVGNQATGVGPYYGDVGMVGHSQVVTISRGSRVSKLSIQGDNCNVTVDDDAIVGKIEFFGHGSTVSIPEDLVLRATQVGANTIIRRQRATRSLEEWPPYRETTPPVTPETKPGTGAPGPMGKAAPAPAPGEKPPTKLEPVDAGPTPGEGGEEEQK